MSQITMYSADWCGDCRRSKRLMDSLNVQYTVIDVEADQFDVTVNIYSTPKTKWWSMSRWKQIWTLLTKGYIEYEASIIMSEQQTFNYAETLKSAVEASKKFASNRKNNTTSK